MDATTRKVDDYTGAASRTSGSQNAAASFALAAGNTYPVGIADPPPAYLLLTPAAVPLALNQPTDVTFPAAASGARACAARVASCLHNFQDYLST